MPVDRKAAFLRKWVKPMKAKINLRIMPRKSYAK